MNFCAEWAGNLINLDYKPMFCLEDQELWDKTVALGIVRRIVSGSIDNDGLYLMTALAEVDGDFVAAHKKIASPVPELVAHRKWREIVGVVHSSRKNFTSEIGIDSQLKKYTEQRWEHIDASLSNMCVDALLVTPEFVNRLVTRCTGANVRIYK